MRTKRMNRRLCFWNFASFLPSWHNRPGNHRRTLPATGYLHRLSRLAPNFPYRRGLLALSLLLPATALAGPAGEQVTAGIATVTRPNSTTTLITQQTPKAIIDWQNFSIAQPEMVRFQQPGTESIALNRVLGNDPSRIFGSLTANGQVFLVNPSGVLFAPGSQVNVHGLLATTHTINNDDFLAGRYTFAPGANPYNGAEVLNQGNLAANAGGYIVLAGDYAANTGVISARLGQVALASGNRFTLDLEGDELIGLAVDAASLAARAGVENFGTLAADGGQVVMTAKVAGELAGTVVNNTGLVQARSIGEDNGEIILYGGTHGIVASSGTLDASGRNIGESGGSVRMLGEKVGLLDQATVDVSGANGGGTVLIGGDFQGRPLQLPLPFAGTADPLPNAQATYLGRDTLIRADATDNGDGGRVIVWADEVTRAYGSISARGGASGGNGGFVEVSGKGYLDFRAMVDTRAPLGGAGTLLLDPANITIQATLPDIDGAISGATNDIAAATELDNAADDFPGADSVITSLALKTLLDSTDVTLAATNNITVNDAVNWFTTDFALTLNAGNDIAVNSALLSNGTAGGYITLSAGNAISIGANILSTSNGDPSGMVTLTAGAGGITKSGGVITAGSLKINSGGSVNLPGYNAVTTIAANLTGDASSFGYESANGFSIGSVGGGTLAGVTTNNGAVTIRGYGANPVQIAESVTAGNGDILIGQAAVGSGGDIDVAAFKTVSGKNVQLYTADANGNLAINGTVSGSSTVSLSIPGILTIINDGVVSGPSLTLAADSMDLQVGASINAGAGTAWLKPYTAGYDIDLGVGATAGDLGLTTNELNTVTTGVLRVGATTAGNLAITAAIAPANATTLSLESGGAITQAGAGTISATNLAIKALGDVTLDTAANLVTNLAANIGDGSNQNKNFLFKNSPALNIGSNINSTSGITIASDANDFDAASPNGVIALSSGAGLTQSAGATLTGKAVYAEGSRVVLTEANPTGVIAGKATGSAAGDLFNYTSSSGIHVTTVNGSAGIQSAGTDPIGVLLAASSAGISQNTAAPISAGTGLMLSTTGPVDLLASLNEVGALAATGVEHLYYKDSNALTLGVSGNGVSTTADNPISITAGGLLTIQDPVNAGAGVVVLEATSIQLGSAAGTTIDGGLIKLRANQATTGTISSAGSSSTVTSGSGMELEADNMDFSAAAPVFTATNEIAYRTFTDNRPITYGAAGCHDGVDCLKITGATNTAPDLVIGNDEAADGHTAGDIHIDGALTHAGRVALLAGGGISQTAAISATSLGFVAGTVTSTSGVTLDQANSISNVAGETQGGDVLLTNTSTFNIVQMSGGLPPYSDIRTVTGIVTNGGDVTINLTGLTTDVLNIPSQINAGAGAVTLTSSGRIYGSDTSPDIIGGSVSVTASGPDIAGPYYAIDGAGGLHIQSPSITLNAPAGGINVRTAYAGTTTLNGASALDDISVIPLSTAYALSIDGAVNAGGSITLVGSSVTQNENVSTTSSTDFVSVSATTGNITMASTAVTSTGGAPIYYEAPNGTVTYVAANFSGATPTITQYVAPAPAPDPEPPPPPPPTIDACTTDPTLSGCSSILPSLGTCTSNPTAPGCTAVLPSIDTCTTTPTAAGCTAVLPTIDTCTTTPTAPGCAAVLPPLTDCTSNPALPGCTAVLPSIDTCTTTPTAPGCTAVLPPLTDCTSNPALPGCTAVLPSIDTCTTTPTASGCSAVLPSITTCTATPTAPGCTAVLPPLTDCTSNPALPGCTAVLPSIDTCTTTPTAPGCTAVLPPLADCTSNPVLPGCTAVLPSMDTCSSTPTAPGCTAVLPTITTCTATPTAPGCTAVLPPLADCTTNPALAGCTAVLPPMDSCTGNPTLPGCTAVLPPLATCVTDPTLPGCTAVLPLPAAAETPVEIVETIQSVVVVDLVPPPPPAPLNTASQPPAAEQPASSSKANNNDENGERRAEEVALTTTSQELPLAKQPIFDLGGGGIAGQNMVCK